MTIKTIVMLAGASLVVPADCTSFDEIHAIGGASAGSNGTAYVGGLGGQGADWAAEYNVAVSPGATLDLQIGVGGLGTTANFLRAPGTSSWVKLAGVKIVQAKGGLSGDANIGSASNPGGTGVPAVGSYDGTYGNVLVPGFGGTGGGSSGAPDDLIPGFNGIGSNGGDTNYAVGQVAGTGGGTASTNNTPPWDAPGQAWMAAGGPEINVGDGGGRIGPPFGSGTPKGHNTPPGTLDSALGGGAGADLDGTATGSDGGNGGRLGIWTDSLTADTVGPGGGGGGGCAGMAVDDGFGGTVQYNCGAGGKGGLGGGGGGSGGIAGPAGDVILGNGGLWKTFTGSAGIPGDGGDGFVVFVYTSNPSPPPAATPAGSLAECGPVRILVPFDEIGGDCGC